MGEFMALGVCVCCVCAHARVSMQTRWRMHIMNDLAFEREPDFVSFTSHLQVGSHEATGQLGWLIGR